MNDEALLQAVLAADEARYQALYARDCEKLDRMLSDDYVHTHANGHTDSKASFIEAIGRGRSRFLNAVRSSQMVRNVAGAYVLSGVTRTSIQVGDEAKEMHNAFLSIWTSTSGDLQMVHWQSTKILD